MASNNIFQYYKVDGGTDLTSDTQFSALGTGTKLIYKPSGEKYIKNSNYSNVFDKTNTFGELEEKVDTNITKLEEKVDTKVIAKIDDADGNGVCSCKNNNNTQIDTFTCHISKTSNNPTLSWGQTSTIGTIDGTPLTVRMPEQPLYDINQGNKRPYVFESIMNWEAMATACNTTIVGIMNISLSAIFSGETYTNAYGGDIG